MTSGRGERKSRIFESILELFLIIELFLPHFLACFATSNNLSWFYKFLSVAPNWKSGLDVMPQNSNPRHMTQPTNCPKLWILYKFNSKNLSFYILKVSSLKIMILVKASGRGHFLIVSLEWTSRPFFTTKAFINKGACMVYFYPNNFDPPVIS